MIIEVDPANFTSEEALTEERRSKAILIMFPMLALTLISLICIFYVKEELNRNKYKLAQEDNIQSPLKFEVEDVDGDNF